MRVLALALVFFCSCTDVVVADDDAYAFASMYIRVLGASERLRAQAEAESKAPNANTGVECIRNSERFQLELKASASSLSKFKLRDVFKDTPETLASFLKYKAAVWARFGEICSNIVAGPVAGVDYQKLTAEMPKLSAQIEYIDKSLFEATPLVFAALLDSDRPNAQNQVDRLTITKAQRRELLKSISLMFAKSIDEKDSNYIVGSARILKEFLVSKYKSSDEPR